MSNKIKGFVEKILSSGSEGMERPLIKKNNESNIPGVYIIGDLAGAPVIKFAMEQGYSIVQHILTLNDAKSNDPNIYDILIVGAGASGLNAALTAKENNLSSIVLEKNKIANTIENFPEGKWVYAEPDDNPPVGKLWLDGSSKEELLSRWHELIENHEIDIRVNEALTRLEKKENYFDVTTSKGSYKAKRIILATGQRGNPGKLKVKGEDLPHVHHNLFSPKHYHDQNIIVVGGGNSAVEAAITLADRNKVYLSYRKGEFARIFKDNERILNEKVAEGKIEFILNSSVEEFKESEAVINVQGQDEKKLLPYNSAFILIGSELPKPFLKSIGIKLENEWKGSIIRSLLLTALTFIGLWIFGGYGSFFGQPVSNIPSIAGAIVSIVSIAGLIAFGVRGDRYSWLGLSFFVCYTIYGIKVGDGSEFWPYTMWGNKIFSFADRPWSFWYTVLYTVLVTVFGIQALKRWGLEKRDSFQVWRFISLISFQWIFFFIIPEFLFQWAVKYQFVGAQLANDPTFAEQAWRAYGIIYAWPLFFYTFFYNPHQVWVVWGILLTFLIIPIFTIWNGKRYCSWICGCGGLAETLGDRWRHLAPKGVTAVKWEKMGIYVLIFAFIATFLMLTKDVVSIFITPAGKSVDVYKILVDIWLVGIIPVTLYPFMGGKVWCRYWCPLAKFMHITSSVFSKIGIGRFGISSNSKCIGCQECSRNCQVGINVMNFALKQEILDNTNSSCIGCGICITACPMDVLTFGRIPHDMALPVLQPLK